MAESLNTACWIGIDLGTTSVKVVLIDCHGEVLRSESVQAHADVSSDEGDCGYEQDPLKIIAVTKELIAKVASSYTGNIAGVGITGQMHGVMLWGSKEQHKTHTADHAVSGKSSHHSNLYTWQDQRCTQEFLASLPSPSDPRQALSTGFGCATLFWLARYKQTTIRDQGFTACGTVMDYLACLLSDLDHPVTSDQLAASFGFYNKETNAWDTVLSQTGSFPYHLLPKIVSAGTLIGYTRATVGLPEGIPVLVAMGDVQCAMHAVLKSPQDAAVNISTSIQLGFVVPKEKEANVVQNSPACISFFPYFKSHVLALLAGLNGGNTIFCFAEAIAQWVDDLGIASNVDPASLLSKLQHLSDKTLASNSLACTASYHPLNVTPVLFGERHDVNMKASVCGLDFASLKNVGLLFRASSEGIVNHLHTMVPPQYLAGQGIRRLLVSGSVPASNQAVMARLRELFSGGGGGSGVVEDSCGNNAKRESGDGEGSVSVGGSGADTASDDNTGSDRTNLEIVVDTQGQEAVGSAVGAARIAWRYSANR